MQQKNNRLIIVVASIASAAIAILMIFLLILGGKSIAANYETDNTQSTDSLIEDDPTNIFTE